MKVTFYHIRHLRFYVFTYLKYKVLNTFDHRE